MSFYHSSGEQYTPTAERHAAACVGHAIAYVLIMHQALTETDLMVAVSSGIFGEAPRPELSALARGEGSLGPLIAGDGLDWLEPRRAGEIESFDGFINWALTADSFNSFEALFSASA